jgi:hypothetical protein
MCSPSTFYILSIIPSSTMSIPTNYFIMVNPPLSYGVLSGGSQFYSMGNPQHGVPSSRGNIYTHMSNPYDVAFSSQVTSMMPLQHFMN